MATIPTLTYPESDESVIRHLLTSPLPASADLFEVTDRCAALVTVLLETKEITARLALCERLSHVLTRLAQLCDEDLPPHLIAQLTVDELPDSAMPDCWQDTCLMVGYLRSLNQALLGNMLPGAVAEDLTGLLHDLVYILRDYVREPYRTH
ncbi:hypothetical protein MXF13_18715 [Leclercia adecarboxylata]|uniref:hypothetical protein n=1 Tax=Leclercia TaxID=83654 RepID=UPI0012E88E8B|nr:MULTISPECIES: hypothetical protein [Leclercia]MEB5751896.1 hypothetical protein [Leclercia adecarboxylata]QGW18651.1 hypothetical protein GNG29_19735 [Leclercia sp. Colony189]URM22351.1 hypothetical protein JJN11_20005 [Leclercia adecarboxylata]